jgi:hypothetical protein
VLRRVPMACRLHPEEFLLPRLHPRLQVTRPGIPVVFVARSSLFLL